MVMRVDVVANALEKVRTPTSRVLLTAPIGKRLEQADCERWASCEHIVIVTGHYEGIDARIEGLVDECVSLGDFVLTGGEYAAVAIIDAVSRLRPGVLGNKNSAVDESFTSGLLEYPHYTRPAEWRGEMVPDVLLSGHHAKIEAWRREQAIQRTQARRPDLLERWRSRVDVEGKDD